MIARVGLAFLLPILLAFTGMAFAADHQNEPPAVAGPIDFVKDLSSILPPQSTQALAVFGVTPGASEALVYALEKRNGYWEIAFGSIEAVIGRNGFAASGEKREGDGKTPSGLFPLGIVFGYEDRVETGMEYKSIGVDDIWVDDPAAADYNRWAKRGVTDAASFEEMLRADGLYKYGIVIEYNTRPVIKGMGSAIFFHIWRGKGEATSGCVATAETDLLRIVRWLRREANPVAVMGQMQGVLR